jgi:hypothetical protein
LLSVRGVDHIWRTPPNDLIRLHDGAASIPLESRPTVKDEIARFNVSVAEIDRPLLAA